MAVREPPHRHNGGPLSEEDAQKLWGHVRALEILDEQAQEIRDDIAARKALAKQDGFDVTVVAAILKRRKNGDGETKLADQMVRIYEESLADEGVLPLEQTRITREQRRRDVEEIGQTLHGQSAPAMPEKRENTDEGVTVSVVLDAIEEAARESRQRVDSFLVDTYVRGAAGPSIFDDEETPARKEGDPF